MTRFLIYFLCFQRNFTMTIRKLWDVDIKLSSLSIYQIFIFSNFKLTHLTMLVMKWEKDLIFAMSTAEKFDYFRLIDFSTKFVTMETLNVSDDYFLNNFSCPPNSSRYQQSFSLKMLNFKCKLILKNFVFRCCLHAQEISAKI